MENRDRLVSMGIVGISSVTVLQSIAWVTGHNEVTIFALTSAIIGGVTGFFFGWERNVKATIAEYIKQKEDDK